MRAAALALALVLPATAAAAQVRIITGPGISPPPRADAPPVRVEPPVKPEPPPAPIEMRRLMPTVVESGALLTHGRLRLRLVGVEALGLDETCRDADGVEWPCGRRMLALMRGFVRLNPVECPLPKTARVGGFDVACTVRGRDIGAVAVAAGWARAADERYAAEAETARRERRGLWGSAPVVPPWPTAPQAGSPDLPRDVTTGPLPGGGD